MYMEGYIMTKAIIKNLRYKYILIYCSMVLVITFLVEVENIDIFDFELTNEEMKQIQKLDRNDTLFQWTKNF